jgi:hypothetical protein
MTVTSGADVYNPLSPYAWMMSDDDEKGSVPYMNDAFAAFLKPAADVNDEFITLLRKEGGIYSFERFVEIFNLKYEKIIGIFGIKHMSQKQTALGMLCAINLARYLKKNSITDKDGIPNYDDFDTNHLEEWASFRAQNRRDIKLGFVDILLPLVDLLETKRDGRSIKKGSESPSPEPGDSKSMSSIDMPKEDQEDSSGTVPSEEDLDNRGEDAKTKHNEDDTTPPNDVGENNISENTRLTPNFPPDPRDFMTRVHDYEFHDKITKEKTRLVKRQTIHSDIKWNDKRESFPGQKERFEGHMIQTGMSHCVTRDFIKAFMTEGYNVLQQFPEYDLTPAQLKHDVAVMFGALKSVFRNGKAKKHLTRNEKEHNGISAWHGMLTEYDHGGDSDVLIEKFDNIINTKFHRNYPGGITGFVDEYEAAFTELTALG